jgi:2-oxo-3-hexenedioate decarboxylase
LFGDAAGDAAAQQCDSGSQRADRGEFNMMTRSELVAIARQIKSAQDEVRQIEPLTSRWPGFDLASAYELAQRVNEARLAEGALTVGRKIGFSNSRLWSQYGVRDPVWGYMYDRSVVNVADQHAVCSLARFAEAKIEPEIVFHFHSEPPTGGNLTAILDCIDWVAHGFEIVQSHFPAWRFEAADTVADGGLHGALLLGQPQPVARMGENLIAALESFSIVLTCDGVVRDTGVGANVLGHPLAAIAHLSAVLAAQPHYQPLQAGDMVSTGTITAAHTIKVGETWRTELNGIALPGLGATFCA